MVTATKDKLKSGMRLNARSSQWSQLLNQVLVWSHVEYIHNTMVTAAKDKF